MSGAWAIAKREIRAFFVSPLAYIVLTTWLLWCGFSFYLFASYFSQQVSSSGTDNPLSAFFGQTMLFFVPLLFFVPALTMRLVAEERRSGTLESLLTTPVTEVSVVLGKYLAAMVFWVVMWLPTLLYVWITSRFGEVDLGAIASSYVGILGIGLYYMAIGLLMSTVSPHQLVSAMLTFMVLGTLFVVGMGELIFFEQREVFAYLSVWGHMDAFSKGLVDSRYLVFDVSLAFLALFLAVIVLTVRRWR